MDSPSLAQVIRDDWAFYLLPIVFGLVVLAMLIVEMSR